MKDMATLLSYYNARDTIPFAQALSHMRKFYHETFQVDLLKNFVSISGFARYISTKRAIAKYGKTVFPHVKEGTLYQKFLICTLY